jgi:hypothetical protein
MKKLLKKMAKQANVAEPSVAHCTINEEKLEDIFEHHNLDPKGKHEGFFKDLMTWRKDI